MTSTRVGLGLKQGQEQGFLSEDVETADVEGPGARKLDLPLPQRPALLLLRKWGQRSDPLKPPAEHWHVFLLLAQEGLLRWPGSSLAFPGLTGEAAERAGPASTLTVRKVYKERQMQPYQTRVCSLRCQKGDKCPRQWARAFDQN